MRDEWKWESSVELQVIDFEPRVGADDQIDSWLQKEASGLNG